ncbi:polymorphic toxin type 50 domain-containing protein, partial [Eubacterium pyruvativorans]|uniref:polymorphic toxin type 50 domain-containing protein n=1 Tax=Eubacterium pyruvativorans TaxID=155865 RepID=UPI003F8A2279
IGSPFGTMLNVEILIIPEGRAIGSFELLNLHHYTDSIVTHGEREILRLINQYKGSGQVKINRKGIWYGSELITTYSGIVGNVVNNLNGKTVPTSVFNIHYDYDSNSGKIRKNRGVHISPYYPSKKRRRR